MIGKLTAYVLRNRPIVVAVLVVFILAGINAYEHLPVEAYPDVSNLRVQVQTLWPGHAAEEVERQVTIPIEAAMNGVPTPALHALHFAVRIVANLPDL